MAINHKDFDITFRRLYTDELPSFIDSLKSIENLPDSLRDSITTVEKNIEQNKTLLEPFVSGGLADLINPADYIPVGAMAGSLAGVAGGIFDKIHKKKQIKKLSGKQLIAIQDNATHFNDTIQRMQQLLGKEADLKPDYKQLTTQEQQELLSLAEEMKKLSKELTDELAA